MLVGQLDVSSFPPGPRCKEHPVEVSFGRMTLCKPESEGKKLLHRIVCDRKSVVTNFIQLNKSFSSICPAEGQMCCGEQEERLFSTTTVNLIKKSRAIYMEQTENEIGKLKCQKSRYRQCMFWKMMRKGVWRRWNVRELESHLFWGLCLLLDVFPGMRLCP